MLLCILCWNSVSVCVCMCVCRCVGVFLKVCCACVCPFFPCVYVCVMTWQLIMNNDGNESLQRSLTTVEGWKWLTCTRAHTHARAHTQTLHDALPPYVTETPTFNICRGTVLQCSIFVFVSFKTRKHILQYLDWLNKKRRRYSATFTTGSLFLHILLPLGGTVE